MDIFSIHALGASGWLALQSLPLLLAPSLITNLLSSNPHKLTSLESYLCRSLGLGLLAFALLQLLLTGLIPLRVGQRVSFSDGDTTTLARSPYVRASLTVTTIYFALTAFYVYTQLTSSFSFAFAAGLTGNTALFALGIWLLLFGDEKARLSKKTGADKRTSGYPFENKESARDIKKEKRKEEKEKEREREREKEKDRESKSSSRRSILKSR